ncbi:phage tail protein [Campylobacter hyointestinalis]|uniref:phage tail protein n=1 Tax=Campylobacter hyointestinalis TaxID=198 RepID=UPI000728EE12|nr:phage tail protein [Campylobacter hyointestinalis]CUU72215.1 phage tail protein [Campylobacter hyointestinalis subsp. hyointestinalis]
MLNLKAYNDVLFRIDEVLNPKFDDILQFDKKYFYEQNDLNRAYLADMFDIEPKSRSLEETKELLNAPLKTYFLEGTAHSINRALSTYFSLSSVKEWFEYGGDPYHFKIDVVIEDQGVDISNLNEMEKIIYAYKNVRSVLDGFLINLNTKIGLTYMGTYALGGESLEIYPYQTPRLETTSIYSFGAIFGFSEIVNINLDLKNIDD